MTLAPMPGRIIIRPTTDTLEEAVRGYVALGSGLDFDTHVLPGNDNGPAPNELYASVLLVRSRQDGMGAFQTDGTDALTQTSVQERYSVQWYRTGAKDAARQFRLWTASAEAQEYLLETGLALVRTSEVRQIDAIIADAWEERAGLDLDIGYIQTLRQAAQVVVAVSFHVNTESATASSEVR